jgi:hypothetical protein
VAAEPAVPAADSTAAELRPGRLTRRRLRPETEFLTELATLPEDLSGAISPQIGQNYAQLREDPDHLFPGSCTLSDARRPVPDYAKPEKILNWPKSDMPRYACATDARTITNNALRASFPYYARPPSAAYLLASIFRDLGGVV